VLFSGGQDSTTCLAWALDRYREVETIGFDYGQRHAIELAVRPVVLEGLRTRFPRWSERLGEDHFVTMRELGQLSRTALTETAEIRLTGEGLPNTFVPARNLLFVTLAAALAYRRGASVLVGGMCETDYSGYPDCRDNTLKALQVAISLGLDAPMTVEDLQAALTLFLAQSSAQEPDGWLVVESWNPAGILPPTVWVLRTCT